MSATTLSNPDPRVPAPNGTCYFFRLPAELRNTIYGHVLYAPAGLFYSYRRWDAKFPLYATKGDSISYRSSDGNQLQYVCRQFYTETSAYGLKVNGVINFFRHSSREPSAGEQFLYFWENCGEKARRGMRTVNLETRESIGEHTCEYCKCTDPADEDHTGMGAGILQMIDFCRGHPEIQVNMRMPRGPQYSSTAVLANAAQTLLNARDLLIAFRQEDITYKVPWLRAEPTLNWVNWINCRTGRSYDGSEYKNERSAEDLRTSNLRFRPPGQYFDEAGFLSQKDNIEMCHQGPKQATEEEAQEMADMLKRWYAEGF